MQDCNFAQAQNQKWDAVFAVSGLLSRLPRQHHHEGDYTRSLGHLPLRQACQPTRAGFQHTHDEESGDNTKWQHVYKHFGRFVNGRCTFEEVDVDLCRKFMEYLLDAPQSIHTNRKLHINSAAGYWSTFRAVLHTAYRDRKIKENPNGFLDRIESIPTMREHLSQEELIRLAETPCEEEVLKRAFLFGCLTGLRKSDIKQLTWQQIQPYTNGKMFVTTRMQKTKQIVHNPISDEAYGLLGERCEGLIFDGFKDKMLQGPLKRWLSTAGITKKITFHCTRHSFGSLHVEMGTDMAVIQAYLGHKNITTTQIYSKMAAQQMCDVVDKITLKRKEA